MATVAGVGTSGAAGASTVGAEQMVAPSVPASGPYLVQAKHISSDIAGRIGHPLNLTLSVSINRTQMEGARTLAYTDVRNSSGGTTGTPARCTFYVNPLMYKSPDTTEANNTLAHEIFHCYQAMDFPDLSAFYTAPSWLIEGEAEWVGDTLYPEGDPFWNAYLTQPQTPLFSRSYDAVGFYSLMTDSGQDTWHLLDPMLKSGGSAGAYLAAANSTLRQNWASSLARQESFGKAWDIDGPGITSAVYHPKVTVLRQGTVIAASVAPYANALIKFNPVADVVTLSATTPNSRLREGNGDEVTNVSQASRMYCVHDCDKCPEMESLPRLSSGLTWLAVTGDSGGASYSVTGGPPSCSCLVGSWTVTAESGSFSGGAGIQWTFSPDNTINVNYANSAPVSGPGGNVFTYRGSALYTTNLPPKPPDTGSYTATPVSQGVTATYTIPGIGQKTTPVTEAAHLTQYTCSGNSLTLNISEAGGTFEYALAKQGG
jgi:hypothetical protein